MRTIFIFFISLSTLFLSLAHSSEYEKLTFHPGYDQSPSISRNGRYLAFVSDRDGSDDIWIKDLGKGLFSAPGKITSSPSVDTSPSLNSDGTKLLYVSHKSDPRGDIYLLDILSGAEKKLTDLNSEDSYPVWGEKDETIYFVRKKVTEDISNLVQLKLNNSEERQVVSGITSCSVFKSEWITCSDGRKIFVVGAGSQPAQALNSADRFYITDGIFKDYLPVLSGDSRIIFSRFQEDTNKNGIIDTSDNASIWIAEADLKNKRVLSFYQVTPGDLSYNFSDVMNENLYFTQILKGEVVRVNLSDFFNSYGNASKAVSIASDLIERGKKSEGLMVMGNISRNLLDQLTESEKLNFAFFYIRTLVHSGKNDLALESVKDYLKAEGRAGEMAKIYFISAIIRNEAQNLSLNALKKRVKSGEEEIINGAEKYKGDDLLFGIALIEIGNLYLVAEEPFKAIDFFIQAGKLSDAEIKARALLSRGEIYKLLNDDKNLINVFIDTIKMTGVDTTWGRQAIQEAISSSEKGKNLEERVSSLRNLIKNYQELDQLCASVYLRIAELYLNEGETQKAIRSLDEIIKGYKKLQYHLTRALERKARIYGSSEDFSKAADSYKELLSVLKKESSDYQRIESLYVLQLVKAAEIKKRSSEVKVAAKEFKKIVDEFPGSVEAHRGYIETKVMLGKYDDLLNYYRKKRDENPKGSVYIYALGLTLTYAKNPDFFKIISLLQEAVALNPGISYFHQTLGWAFEQNEKIGGNRGYLEQASSEYLAALELNDIEKFPDVEGNLLLNLGNTWLALRNYDEAYRFYRERDTLNLLFPHKTTEMLYRKSYGEACFKTGRTKDSILHYLKALDLVPEKNIEIKMELLERVALSYQDLNDFSRAIRYFSESLNINLKLGLEQNVALLQRNVGINLYNLSLSETGTLDRDSLKLALKSYFESLDSISKFGVRGKKEGRGFIQLETGLSGESSLAARGFDRKGEEKMIFGYIANTYENLSEAKPAIDNYLKKLTFFPKSLDYKKDVALLTEKAVVLNRAGILYYVTGDIKKAIDFLTESLEICRRLELINGEVINFYNLSKVYSSAILTDFNIEFKLVDVLIKDFELYLGKNKPVSRDFFTLSNMGYFLSLFSKKQESDLKKIENGYRHFNYLKFALYYYEKAFKFLEKEREFSLRKKSGYMLAMKMNLMELYLEFGLDTKFEEAKRELKSLSNEKFNQMSWIPALITAEESANPIEKEKFLNNSLESLIFFPPIIFEKGEQNSLIPLYDYLERPLAELYIQKKEYINALSVIEKIEMRKLATSLFDKNGESIFYKGIKEEYRTEISATIEEARRAIEEGKADNSNLQFEELIFAMYEETPQAVSFLYQYPVSEELFSKVLKSGQGYIRVIPSEEGYHLFLTLSNKTAYYHVSKQGITSELKSALEGLSQIYLAAPPDIYKKLKDDLPAKNIIVNLNNAYELFDSWQKKSVFINNVAVTGTFMPDEALMDKASSITIKTLTGDKKSDQKIIGNSNIVIVSKPVDEKSVLIYEESGVNEHLNFEDISPEHAHTLFLLNIPDQAKKSIEVTVASILKAGFPHVVINNDAYDAEVSKKLVTLYMNYLADLSPSEALATAIEDVSRWKGAPVSFSLFGYAGMDEDERKIFANSLYKDELTKGIKHFKAKEYESAFIRFENTLWLAGYADKKGDLKKILQLLVESAFKTENFEKAVNYQERYLLALNAETEPDLRASALYTLGILYSRVEQFEKAVKNINEAINFWEKSGELDRIAQGRATIGVVKENMGSYEEAFSDFSNSFSIYQELGEKGSMAGIYQKMGRINYLRLGRYEKARKEFEAANAIYKEVDDKKGVANTLYEIAFTYEKMGLFDNALKRYQEAISIGKSLSDNGIIASGLLYQANTAWFQGNYQEAFNKLLASKKLLSASDTKTKIMIENTRGLIYWTLNDSSKAMSHLNIAVDLSKKENIDIELASSLNNLGLVYRQTGDIEKSLIFFQEALEIDKKLKSSWGIGYDYRNIGISLMRLNRLTDAEKSLSEAEKISGQIEDRVNQVKSLMELGEVNQLMGDYKKAESYFLSAYNMANGFGIKEVAWRSAAGLGLLKWKVKELEPALNWYSNAVQIVENMRASLKIDELKNSYQLNKMDLYEGIVKLLVEMKRDEEAFNYLERGRSRSFIDLLGNNKITLKSSDDQKKLDELNRMFINVENLAKELGASDKPDEKLKSEYDQAKNGYEEALIELKQSSPQVGSFVAVDPLTLRDFEALLDQDTAAISYMVTDKKTFIWLVKREGTTFHEINVERAAVDALVKKYRESVQLIEPVESVLKELYDFLIKPVRKELEGKKYLAIIPDGALHYLSFSALIGEHGYLIDDFPVFYSPSASVFKFTFAKRNILKSEKTRVLAIGNPDLGNFNYDLPMAELEAGSIKWSFPEIDVLTGIKATKEWILSNISKYGIIHVASHGEFNDINPLLSALMLSTENGSSAGALTVQEIFSLDLKADIVTLSACQTGLGQLKAGELIGLNRAFIYAGTHSIISSLWRVDDLSTAVLMKHFYRNYRKMNKAESLRSAQLLIRKNFPHPSYWAGFSLVGDYK